MKIHINRIPGGLVCELFIFTDTKSRFETYFTIGKDGMITANQFERLTGGIPDIKPAIRLGEFDMRELIDAFIIHAKQEGYRTADESHTKGRLEATENHLMDMRTLLKLK